MKPVHLIFDAYRWCWHYQALDIQHFAERERFDVEICASGEWHDDRARGPILNFSCMEAARPEVVTTVIAHHGPTFSQFDESYVAKAATTAQRNLEHAQVRLPQFRRIICVNRRLHEFAKIFNPESVLLPAGVNLEVFPYQKPRAHKRLVVGWCGQLAATENTKGYGAVLLPLRYLCDDQFEFRLNVRDHSDPLSREEMREWYADIDVFLCTASTEGTPMPPLEAMACGRPVITTPVGDLPDIVQHAHNGILVSPLTGHDNGAQVAHEIHEWLQQLDSPMLAYLGQQAHETIATQRNWKQLANQWLEQVI
jgi:hypothetical protein